MDIKIFMCCHKEYDIVPPLCIPIQGGSAINPPVNGALRDDDGDNISEKNREYCELTVHYYAWKNIKADYYGFCHYRRFFCFDESVNQPYIAVKDIPLKKREKLLGKGEKVAKILKDYDIIIPKAENVGVTVEEYYRSSNHHYGEDLDLFIEILNKKSPKFTEYAKEYLAQNGQYFCNMFIMKREHFNEYCETLFYVLEEFDKQKKSHGTFQSDRTDGYLAERFTGIFITYLKDKGVKIKKVSRIDVGCTFKKRFVCKLLPPGSHVRLWIKSILKTF